MTWEARSTPGPSGTLTVHIHDDDGSRLSRAYALELLNIDAAFRAFLVRTLAAAPFEAFCWEMPPSSKYQKAADFEFVLVDAPMLARARADSTDFKQHLDGLSASVLAVGFRNLGGDAMLLVPTSRAPEHVYAHLATFVRGAPPDQVDSLLQLLASTMSQHIEDSPVFWVSTAGGGVSWLHVRIDSAPKYYRHQPYRHRPRHDSA